MGDGIFVKKVGGARRRYGSKKQVTAAGTLVALHERHAIIPVRLSLTSVLMQAAVF
jgi:hypothetical protein